MLLALEFIDCLQMNLKPGVSFSDVCVGQGSLFGEQAGGMALGKEPDGRVLAAEVFIQRKRLKLFFSEKEFVGFLAL